MATASSIPATIKRVMLLGALIICLVKTDTAPAVSGVNWAMNERTLNIGRQQENAGEKPLVCHP